MRRLTHNIEVTIGGTNPTNRVCVLGHCLSFALPGVVAGVQLAGGCLNFPEPTQDGLLPDPVLCSGEAVYKTGDRGC